MTDAEVEKRSAALEAIKHVKEGMLIGIGTGSTVSHFIDELSRKVAEGLKIMGVPTSTATQDKAVKAGIPVTTSPDREIDITFDGADEADKNGNLIKGGGGALLREKIIAFNSRKMYVMIDSSKLKPAGHLGSFPLPVEVLPFLEDRTKLKIEDLGGSCSFRRDKQFKTDNGNLILDCDFGKIENPKNLESKIKHIPGVVEVGIFSTYASKIFEGRSERCMVYDVK